ncbi:MAG: methyltransferase domain-containing protein [Pseudomonadota bacterium]|nr:methyltransferase domain-containing protein [Pseudomonadota bacterium]
MLSFYKFFQQVRSESTLDRAVVAGQAVYTQRTLWFYDAAVLGVSNYLIWRCPTHRLLQLYRTHLSAEHLEIGVGTGFFLKYTPQPKPQRLALVDLNLHALRHTQARLKRPTTVYQRNVLQPLDLPEAKFKSAAINYVLHCVVGDLYKKSVILDHVIAQMQSGGVIFGSTLLQGENVPRSLPAKGLMALYNHQGIFHNQNDSLEDLQDILAARFEQFDVIQVGCAALFWAKVE